MFETVFCIVITGEDEDAWTLNEVAANWAFEDVESGIKHCEWAIGNFNVLNYPMMHLIQLMLVYL